jgi:ElaB/YqjD/DUF883 family membrane-anchored ribosome-binding protein
MTQIQNRMHAMARDARHGLDDAVTMASDQGRRAMHAGEAVAGEATRRIRDYPVATVLAAAALGLFTGFLMSRR